MKNTVWSMLVVLVVLGIAPVVALPYQAGPFTVDVEVRNGIMLPIPDAKVTCVHYSATKIRVSASATGYVGQSKFLDIWPNQQFYKHDFVLADVPKKITVCDTNGRQIKSAYFNLDQYGYVAGEFGITVFIPKKLWEQPTAAGCDVFENFWGMPLKRGAEFASVEEYHQVRIRVSRRALDWTSKVWYVVFATKARDESPSELAPWLERLARLEQEPSAPREGATRLAAFIYRNFSFNGETSQRERPLPATLQSLIDQGVRFSQLHRDTD